jgi:hypothetical protein
MNVHGLEQTKDEDCDLYEVEKVDPDQFSECAEAKVRLELRDNNEDCDKKLCATVAGMLLRVELEGEYATYTTRTVTNIDLNKKTK